MIAFVAGATGYTGREVVRVLRERGVETWAHVRPDSRELPRWQERFEVLGAHTDTTPWESAAMEATLRRIGPDLIFGLLGTTRARGRSGSGSAVADTYEAVDYGLTAMVFDAASAAGLKARLVYLSSLGASVGSSNAYLEVRGRIEARLAAGALPFTVVRPSFVTGPDREEDRPAERISAQIADGALSLLGALGARRLADRYRSISGAQLAEVMVRLSLDPAAAGRTFETDQLR